MCGRHRHVSLCVLPKAHSRMMWVAHWGVRVGVPLAQGKAVVAASAAKRHTAVVTADGEVWTWGHKLVTPRKVNLAGVRDTARAALPLPTPSSASGSGAVAGAAQAPGAQQGASAAAAGSSGSSTVAEVRFHRHHTDVVRPAAVAVAAGWAHTTVATRTGSVLTWRSADPALKAHEVLGPLAGALRWGQHLQDKVSVDTYQCTHAYRAGP